jgi:hypothetical protein
MGFDVRCDTCDFGRTVDAEWEAYGTASDHEAANPAHCVAVLPR